MQKVRNSIPYLAVFFCTLIFISLFKLPFQEFSDSRDPYYHIAHASAYLHNTEIQYPQLSNLASHPADLWLGYHLILAASFFGTEEGDLEALITRTILVHIVLSALLVVAIARLSVVYFHSLQPFYRQKLKSYRFPLLQPNITNSTLIAIMLGSMFFFSATFLFRIIFTERPHVLMILLVTLALLFLIRRRYILLTILAGLSALCYSMSLLIFIPAAILFFGWLLTDRSKPGLRQALAPFCYTLAGYIIGLLLHPATWGYILNGILFTSFATLHSLFWWFPKGMGTLHIPAEMGLQGNAGLALFLPITVLMGVFWQRIQERKKGVPLVDSDERHVSQIEAGFCGIALLFGLVSLTISRTVEYAVPLLFITSITFLFGYLYSLTIYLHQHLLNSPEVVVSFYQQAIAVIKKLTPLKTTKILFSITTVFVLVIFLMQSHFLSHPNDHEADRLQEAIAFLTTQEDRQLILMNEFSMYTQAVFYGPTNRYATGMDSRMTYFHNPEFSSLLNTFLYDYDQKYCKSSCVDFNQATILNFLHQIEATHLILDHGDSHEDSPTHVTSWPFLEKQYQSEKYPEVQVYRIVYE